MEAEESNVIDFIVNRCGIRPTELQTNWLVEYLTPGTPAFLHHRIAAERAGYAKGTAARVGWDNKIKFNEAIGEWLNESYPLADVAITGLLRLCEAHETKFFAHQGNIISEENVEALGIQLKALSKIAEIAGLLNDKEREQGNVYNVTPAFSRAPTDPIEDEIDPLS